MDMESLKDLDHLTEYDRGWIAGWLMAKRVDEPTFDQFREAVLALVAFQSNASTAQH